MGNVKIEFSIGEISFSGEGEDTWIEKQLDKIIEKAPELIKIAPSTQVNEDISGTGVSSDTKKQDAAITAQTLPNFLKSKNALKNQQTKFLATAIWLHAKGNNRLSTSDVTKALKNSNQPRLGNASECLAQLVKKGYIEIDGKQFFVTDDGRNYLH